MPTPRSTVAALAATTLLLAACGSDDDTATAPTETPPAADEQDPIALPVVVATTTIWADVTANVACDGLAEIETIIPPGGDPHSFEPSLRDRETMENADLVVANGLFLEESLIDTIDAVEQTGVPVLRVGDGLATIEMGEYGDEDHADDDHNDEAHADEEDHADEEHADEEEHADDEEHGHDGADPHVWWDPTRVAEALPAIAEALVAAGLDEAEVDACAERYGAELAALDDEIEATVTPLPVDDRLLVTNHDSLGYFADRYDFAILGSVIPSSSSLAATSAAELDALAAEIEATGVPAIFAETQHSSADAEALADRIGDVEVVELLTGTLGEPGSEADNYVGWLRQNATTIVDALSADGER